MATVDSEVAPRRRRSEARVEVWRNEVATATGMVRSPLTFPTTESPGSLKSRPTSPESSSGRRKSFISFTKVKTAEHVPPPLERPGFFSKVKLGLKTMRPRGVERTGMYGVDIEEMEAGRVHMSGEDDTKKKKRVKVIDIESLSDLSGEKGALVAKRERLDRAARLMGNEDAVTRGGQ